METPKRAGDTPQALDLDPGTYHWCKCGKAAKQPFCDGSHRGTEFSPVTFTIEKKETKYLCLCKQTKNPPYCDGSHNNS